MTKKSIARRHHYVPQGYLARFTDTETKDGQFLVLDVTSGTRFRTSPKNVAVETDFNRIDIDNYAPDYVENELAKIEGSAIRAIGRVANLQDFPSDEDYSAILHLICLLSVRNPKHRESFNLARETTIRRWSELLVSDEKIWSNHIEKAKANGIDIPESVSFEDFRTFVENDEYDIQFHQQGNLAVEMTAWEKILYLLHERTWSLIVAPEDGPEFICSDHPAALAYKNGANAPVGLATRGTELFFPLTRRLGFYGVYEDALKEVVHAKLGNVATMNQRVAFSAKNHVFSARNAFAIWLEGKVQYVECGV
jgi:hypothetical protein